jgi:hypothetical protein
MGRRIKSSTQTASNAHAAAKVSGRRILLKLA